MQDDTLHAKIGAIIGLDIAKEQLETISVSYQETAKRTASDKAERRAAQYNLKKCEDAIKANATVRAALNRDLSEMATGPEAMALIQDAISHNTDLFYSIIQLDYEDQKRVAGLMDKIRRDKIKKVA